MADESNPWIGTTAKQEVKRPNQASIVRKDPVSERTINNAEILAGNRGHMMDHAVRFRDLENIKLAFEKDALKKFNENLLTGDLSQQLAGQFAAIDAESKALLADFNATFDAVGAEIALLDGYVADLEVSFSEGFADVYATLAVSYYTIAQTDAAISAVQTSLTSSINGVSANLSANYYTRSATDSAIATSFNTLSTTVNGHTTTISSQTTSINGIKAVHGIRINNNGHVSGFGLISSIIAGVPVSDFIIADASFRIVNSSGVGNYTPFAVYPTGRTIGGVFIPAGVHAQDLYVTNANIGNAQIDNAKIKDLAVDTLKIAGNAVTVPVISYGLGTKTGNNAWQDLALIIVQMPVAGENAALMWNISQGYGGSMPTWGFRLLKTVGATTTVLFSREGMVYGNDYPSGAFLATGLPIGDTYFVLQWKGQNSDIQAEGVLIGLGVAR